MTQGLLSRSLPMLDLAISSLSTASDYMLPSPVVQSMYSKFNNRNEWFVMLFKSV